MRIRTAAPRIRRNLSETIDVDVPIGAFVLGLLIPLSFRRENLIAPEP